MINRTIFKGQVYYSVKDLAKLFKVSEYRMRKAIKDQKIKTYNKIFGRTVFVLEENVSLINAYGEVKTLKTDFTADPVKEEKVVPFDKPKRKTKKRKKSVNKKESVAEEVKTESVTPEVKTESAVVENTEVAQVKEVQPEMNEEQKQHKNYVKKLESFSLQYVQECRSDVYNKIYSEFMGAEIDLDDTTPEHNKQLKDVIEMLEMDLEETYAQAMNL